MGKEDQTEIIKKIIQKKEFSEIPLEDVKLVFSKIDKENLSDYEKLKLTRELLRRVYSSFTSQKLLSLKKRTPLWVLMKHKSTKERLPFYDEIYKRCLRGFEDSKNLLILDLGAGVNGFSFEFFIKINSKIKYLGVEAVGQLCKLMNSYFIGNSLDGEAIHASLFDEEEILKIIRDSQKNKIVFLLKVVDSIEMIRRDYSKFLIKEAVLSSKRVVVSFATKSLGNRKSFSSERKWLLNFISENFNIEDDFEFGGERYLLFSSFNKKDL